MELVAREEYLSWLTTWRDKDVIKAVTGVRRCGKSTLLRLFENHLRASGVDDQHIIAIDLENVDHDKSAASYVALYEHVMARAPESGTTYVFIDEVQLVPEFEKAVASLRAQANLDVYITGSNASLLASDLATRLTGRYVELSILPLSFREWTSGRSRVASLDAYRLFASYGSFPFTLQLEDQPTAVIQYLGGVLDTIIGRDVAVRRRVANMAALFDVVSFMADNIGNLTSPRRIADTLTSKGRRVTAPTVESYLDGLAEAYLLYPVNRYNIRGKRRLERIQKYYLVDPGLRTAMLGRSAPDRGRVLENVIYLELLRRHGRVFAGKLDNLEVDFVVEWNDHTEYIQVAETTADPVTLERELAPLRRIPNFHPRTLITLDPTGPHSFDGISQAYAPEWLHAGEGQSTGFNSKA